jgi:hypothetical protein
LLLIICLPLEFHALHDARVDILTKNFVQVATPALVNSANLTLTKALWGDDISSVTSVTSNITGDLPSTDNYTAISKVLEVGGLLAGEMRSISVEYEIASVSLSELPSVSQFLIVIILFTIMAILGMIAGAIYLFFQR